MPKEATSIRDFRHRLSISYTYELPFGRGKAWGSSMNSFENAVVGGWQVGGITTIRSGEHYTAFRSFDPTNTGTAALPDLIHNPNDFSFDVAGQAALAVTGQAIRPSSVFIIRPPLPCPP